jgi:long-chain acyl-CoA synthetase
VAGGLREADVRQGDRVAIHLPNGTSWALACFGAILAGGVVVPVNTRFAPPEVDYVLRDCQPSYTFEPGDPWPDAKPFVEEAVGADDPLAIFYTSGTTGFPKGALMTHVSVLAFCENLARMYSVGPEEGTSTALRSRTR